MEKVINIEGRNISFKCTGATLLRYKEQTGNDPLYDFLALMSALKMDKENIVLEGVFRKVGTEPLYNMVWALAKTADESIPPLLEWLDEFDEFPIYKVTRELSDLIIKSFKNTIELKKK